MVSPLRRRIETSSRLAHWLAAGLGRYLAWCDRTTTWTVEGRDALLADLAQGPVIYAMWHARTLLAPAHFPGPRGSMVSLHDGSPIGRVGGEVQRYFGLVPVQMTGDVSRVAAARHVVQAVRARQSVGVTGDGPKGPVHVLNEAAPEWARITGYPVWGYAFAMSRCWRLGTWDSMVLPRPYGRGAIVFRRLDGTIDRKADPARMTAAATAITALLTTATARAETLAAGR
jgi:lysophospholipid acyltransferase (LPLAT)-like uncharacterized protein